MKKWFGFLGALLFSCTIAAQTTVVSGVATDSDGTLWTNGTVSVQFVPGSSQSNLNVYRINGAPLSSAVVTQGPISLGNSGSFSVTVYDNTQVTPSGSQWQFTVCPNAISKCGSVTTSVTGVSQNITTAVDAAIPAPRFLAVAGGYGYTDVESILSTPVGGTYWNVTDLCQRYYNGSTWNCGSGEPMTWPTFTGLTKYGGSSNWVTPTYADVTALWTTCTDYLKSDGTCSAFPSVGTWGALNYPTWVSGTPFVKMTAAGTFALDTNTYLTSSGVSGMTQYGLAVAASASTVTSSVQPASWTTGHTFIPVWQPSGSALAPGVMDANTLSVSYASTAGSAATTNALTVATSGGAAPNSTFNGSGPVTIDYHSVGASPPVYYNVLSYGAVSDAAPTTGYLVASLSVGSTTLTCSTCGFTAAAVGKYVAFQPWYNAYVPFATTPSVAKITGYLGPTQVTLDKTGAVTANFAIWWGTDNVPAFNACAADAIAKTNGGTCWIPAGNYLLATSPYSSITGARDDGAYGTGVSAGGSGGTVTCTPSAGSLTSGGCVVSGGTLYKHSATLQTTYASGGCSGYLGWGYGSCGSGVLVTVATNSSGVPTAATVVYGGTNITSPVVFNVTPLGGDGAAATATETGGAMNTPTLTAGGDGYAASSSLSGYVLGGGCTTYQTWGGTPIAGTVSVGTNASGSASGTITVTHNATGCTSSPTIIFGSAACNTGTIGSPAWGQCSNVAPLNPIALPVQVMLTMGVNFNGASGAGGPGTGVNLYGTWDTLSVDNYEPAMFGGTMQYEDIGQFTLHNGFLGIAVTNNANYSKIHDIGFNTAIGMWTGATDLGFVADNLSFGGYASWINGGTWSTRLDFPLGNGGFFDAAAISNIIVRVAAYGGPGSISQQLDDWFANNFWRPEFSGASTDFSETCKYPQALNQRQASHSLSDVHQGNSMCYRGISSLGMAILTRDSRSTGNAVFTNLDVKQVSRYLFYGSLGGMIMTNIGGEAMTPLTGTNDPYRNATTQEGWLVYIGDSGSLNSHPSINVLNATGNSNATQTLWDIDGLVASGTAGLPFNTKWYNLSNSNANANLATQNPDFQDLIQFPLGAEISVNPSNGAVAPLYFDAYYGNAIHRAGVIKGEYNGMEFMDPTLTTDWMDVTGGGITTHVPLNAPLYFYALGGSSGPAANLLAVYQGATGLVGVAGVGATNVIGIANSNFSSPYSGLVLSSGIGTCVADNTVTIGNLIGVGTTTAGRCKDLGTVNFSAVSQALQIVGVATTGASAGGTFTLQFFGPGYYGTSVALGTTVKVNGGTALTTENQVGLLPYLCADTSGSGTAQSCTTTPSFTPQVGNCLVYTTTTPNSSTNLTLNVNGSGPLTVQIPSASGWTGVYAAVQIPYNTPLTICYSENVDSVFMWNVQQTGTVSGSGSSTGTTGTITGTVLAGTCDSGTASVTGAVVGHPVAVSSTTGADMGGAFNVRGSVTSTGTVTVYVCGTGTPASLAYNVTVF